MLSVIVSVCFSVTLRCNLTWQCWGPWRSERCPDQTTAMATHELWWPSRCPQLLSYCWKQCTYVDIQINLMLRSILMGLIMRKLHRCILKPVVKNQQITFWSVAKGKLLTAHTNKIHCLQQQNQTTANVTEYIPRSRFKLVVYSFKSREFVIYKGKSWIMRSQATWSVVHIKSEIRNMFSQYINGTDQSTILHDSL